MVGDGIYPAWQRERSGVNHDWLQNQFILALGKWENICNGDVEDERFEAAFVPGGLRDWPQRREDLSGLIDRFEREMSPIRLFADPPLSHCDTKTRAWLPDLIHSLWLERYRVKELVFAAREAIESADRAFFALKRFFPREGSNSRDRSSDLARAVAEFRTRCEQLARCISKFPSEIRVV